MPLADLLSAVEQPFPGLRSFEMSESLLFFGREEHTEELLRRLASGRFLAVVGSSGSGKSSLVRAGLLPALYRGYLVDTTTHWRIAVLRPGGAPLANLAQALAHPDALGPGDDARRLSILSSSSMGLVEVVREAKLAPGESVLVVADQFEELFRYRQPESDDSGAEAALLVGLLLEAAERFDASIYVVLTMRSDFLGDCTQFPGLAETLSRSQYLIPRLTREQRQQAIQQPLRLAGAGITTRLVQQLLNDSREGAAVAGSMKPGGAPDPLPVMQHALMRTFRNWKQFGAKGDIDLPDYDSAGGMERALDRHAETVYKQLDPVGQVWAGKLFRALTTTELGRPTRRPTRLDRLYKIVGAAAQSQQIEVNAVVRAFLDRENSLLISSSKENLEPGAVLDIPHESLIWKWDRLREWVRQEAISAEWYLDLAKDAASFQKGESGLWRDPNLTHALRLAESESWNADWAAHYHPGDPTFAETQGFLKRSYRAQLQERWMRGTALAVIVAAFITVLTLYIQDQRVQARNRTLSDQVEEIRKERAEAELQSRKNQDALNQARADLDSKKAFLSPEQQAQKEKEIRELQGKVDDSQQELRDLKAQQDQTSKLLKENADVATLNRTLTDRVGQLQAKADSLEKDRQSAVNQTAALQKQLDSANREIARLKTPPVSPASLTAGGTVATSPGTARGNAEPGRETRIRDVTTLRVGDARVNAKDGLTYVWIPAGKFRMGCSSGDSGCKGDENPAHDVTITKGFWIGRTEVTQEAYQRVSGSNPSQFQGAKLPVESVSWNEADSYCRKVGMRLPTEAEWEYAARAGSTGSRYGSIEEVAWYKQNSGNKTHQVAQKAPNAWGLYDTLGNVFEWTADWYAGKLPAGATDPAGPTLGIGRALRGSSWNHNSSDARASFRDFAAPYYRDDYIGVRCVGDSP